MGYTCSLWPFRRKTHAHDQPVDFATWSHLFSTVSQGPQGRTHLMSWFLSGTKVAGWKFIGRIFPQCHFLYVWRPPNDCSQAQVLRWRQLRPLLASWRMSEICFRKCRRVDRLGSTAGTVVYHGWSSWISRSVDRAIDFGDIWIYSIFRDTQMTFGWPTLHCVTRRRSLSPPRQWTSTPNPLIGRLPRCGRVELERRWDVKKGLKPDS